MPRKTKKGRQQRQVEPLTSIAKAIADLWFFAFYGSYSVIKSLVTRRPIEEPSIKQRKAFKRTFAGFTILIVIVIGACLTLPGLWRLFVLIAVIFLLTPMIILLGKRRKRKAITSEIGKYLQSALEAMDSTAKWYTTEEEANKELVACLKAKGIRDVTYQYKLRDGETVDAKVGNILIEGKLSPDMAEVDRLLGQLTRYTQFGEKVNVVIYGPLDKYARSRIEKEIQSRYPNRVFLAYLDHPKRQRARNLVT